MKFLVEIDTSTKEGTAAINYLKQIKPAGKSVYIRKFTGETTIPLSPEELGLPFGRKPTKKEITEFLNRKQGKGADIEIVRRRILDKLAKSRK